MIAKQLKTLLTNLFSPKSLETKLSLNHLKGELDLINKGIEIHVVTELLKNGLMAVSNFFFLRIRGPFQPDIR